MRFGEASALRLRSYDRNAAPLGQLQVAASYNTRTKKTGGLKTARKGVTSRLVPVHPTLAKLLAAWRIGGWARMLKRIPTADDLIIPSRRGRNRGPNHGLRKLHGDLALLGLRVRRQHDARRTLISLAQADGATKETLRPSTHPRPMDQFDEYSTIPWEARCRAISQLRIELLEGKVVQLRAAAGAGSGPIASSEDEKRHQEATVSATLSAEKGEGPDSGEESGPSGGGVYGTRRPPGEPREGSGEGAGSEIQPLGGEALTPGGGIRGHSNPTAATSPEPWREELAVALERYDTEGGAADLAGALASIAAELLRGRR